MARLKAVALPRAGLLTILKMAFGESVVARWPGGRHIYLVGKSTSQKTAFGEFAVARWPGGQSHLSSGKIYELCSMRLRAFGKALDQLRIPFRYLM